MGRYINAEDLKSKITELSEDDYYTPLNEYVDGLRQRTDAILEIVDEMPSADVRENIHGKWIKDIANPKIQILPIVSEVVVGYHCSNCEEMVIAESEIEYSNYCPNCGADMRERKETDDRPN